MALILIFHLKETIDQYKLGHLHWVSQSSEQLERDQSSLETAHAEWEWQQQRAYTKLS